MPGMSLSRVAPCPGSLCCVDPRDTHCSRPRLSALKRRNSFTGFLSVHFNIIPDHFQDMCDKSCPDV